MYNDPGPKYPSFHTLVGLPNAYVLFACGSKLAPKPVPPAVLSKYATSTATAFAVTLIPPPAPTLIFALPLVAPPVKPSPATTAVMSAPPNA